MWYESFIPRVIFVALVLLVLLAGVFTLRLAWENTPEAEAQGDIQQPGPIQEPEPIQEPGPIQQPGSQQRGGQLMNAGGSADGPAPVMPGGGCPTEFPIERDGACYR